MRILSVHNAYQSFGGEDVVAAAEVELLRARGHTVEAYRRHNDEIKTMPLASAAAGALWSRRAAREVGDICDALRPDVVHVHNTFPLISPAIYWVAARRNIPVVQTLHNYRLLCPQATFLRAGAPCHDCLGKSTWRAVVHRCYRDSALQSAVLAGMLGAHRAAGTWRGKVSRYIALSEYARERFIAGGLPPGRVLVKPNFVDGRAPPGWQGRRGGLFVGRLTREKGVAVLCEAMRADAGLDVEVIGDGPLAADVRLQFGSRYLGFLSRPEIQERMRAAAFLLVPSIGHEQMPTTILEAFASGLPVIASRLGALDEIVEHFVTGLLVRPGDKLDLAAAIGWARAHPAEMERMGRNARALYEARYSPSVNHDMLVKIYEDAIEEASSAAQRACRPRGTGHLG